MCQWAANRNLYGRANKCAHPDPHVPQTEGLQIGDHRLSISCAVVERPDHHWPFGDDLVSYTIDAHVTGSIECIGNELKCGVNWCWNCTSVITEVYGQNYALCRKKIYCFPCCMKRGGCRRCDLANDKLRPPPHPHQLHHHHTHDIGDGGIYPKITPTPVEEVHQRPVIVRTPYV